MVRIENVSVSVPVNLGQLVFLSRQCLSFSVSVNSSVATSNSYMRDPGQSWSLGWPLAHLKYFLQLSGFGNSSPSLEQEVLQPVVDQVDQLVKQKNTSLIK